MLFNPPWGTQTDGQGDEPLEALYSSIGDVVRERFRGWQLWLLGGNPSLTRALRLKAGRRIPASAGRTDCLWLHYAIR